jgi:hypothetical protein
MAILLSEGRAEARLKGLECAEALPCGRISTFVLHGKLTNASLRLVFHRSILNDMLHEFVPPIGFSLDLGQSMEGVLRWENTVRWMESALPTLHQGVILVVFCWVTALFPLSVFRKMHPLIGKALRTSSLYVAGVCWVHCFIVTYRMMGWLAVMTGLLFAGVGVVPMALLATATKGDWNTFGGLSATLALTLIPRILAKLIARRSARMQLSARARSYSVDDYNL